MKNLEIADLTTVGYSAKQAHAIMEMSNIERVRRMSIVGNAWSDMPLFQACHAVYDDSEATFDEKWEAYTKHCMATGEAPRAKTLKQAKAEFAAFMDLLTELDGGH